MKEDAVAVEIEVVFATGFVAIDSPSAAMPPLVLVCWPCAVDRRINSSCDAAVPAMRVASFERGSTEIVTTRSGGEVRYSMK